MDVFDVIMKISNVIKIIFLHLLKKKNQKLILLMPKLRRSSALEQPYIILKYTCVLTNMKKTELENKCIINR